jgi:hypothetical protein
MPHRLAQCQREARKRDSLFLAESARHAESRRRQVGDVRAELSG